MTKLRPQQVEGFLARPDPHIRVVLVYGPDAGMVRERSQALVRAIAGDPPDPFRLAELTGSGVEKDPARLADEAAAMAFGGGQRAVRVAESDDGLAEVVEGFLAHPMGDALIVIEADNLGPTSDLRRLCENAENAVALPCYADDAESLGPLVRRMLSEAGLKPSGDAVAFLVDHLGSDRMVTRSEIDKLVLYMGGPGPVSLDDARACVGDNAAISLDDVVFAVGGGDFPTLEHALTRALDEGTAPVSLLRAVMRHLQRLQLANAAARGGQNLDQAVQSLRPPVFFKQKPAFMGQVRSWSPDRLAQAMELLLEAEIDCKTTGLPPEAICSRALLRVAQGARAR